MPKVKKGKSSRQKREERKQRYNATKITLSNLIEALATTEISPSHVESDDDIALIVQNIDTPDFLDENGASTSKVSGTKCVIKQATKQQDKKLKRRISERERYHGKKQYQNKMLQAKKRRYDEDEAYKEKKKSTSMDMYHNNEPYREKKKATSMDMYHNNEPYREKKKATSRATSMDRYHNNEPYREKKKAARRRNRFVVCASQKLAMKLRYRKNKHLQVQNKFLHRAAYAVSRAVRIAKIRSVLQRRAIKKRATQKKEKMIQKFVKSCKNGPVYVCCVCHRLSFDKQVKVCEPEKLTANTELTELCVTHTYLHSCDQDCGNPCSLKGGPRGKLYICNTCHRYLTKGKMPPQAKANNLQTEKTPNELHDMNSLEQQLIAQTIPFSKIVALPKGGQKGIKGGVVCVPSSVQETTKALPRPMKESELIAVKLKRKLQYKGHVQYKKIDIAKLQIALDYLKKNNPCYADVEIDTEWHLQEEDFVLLVNSEEPNQEMHDVDEPNDRIPESMELNLDAESGEHDMHINDSTESDKEEENPDPRDLYRSVPFDSCLQPPDLRTEAMAELENMVYSVAPAEGNKPISLFRPDGNSTEATSFPALFPTGKNTFQSERETKISLSKYFNARLFDADTRFAENSEYIFYAQYAKELDQLLSSISIAIRKGSANTRNGQRVTARNLSDDNERARMTKKDLAYHHFDTLRGTPDYWKRTMNDLFSMIRQLGIPTWFCTFSAAELSLWPEVIETIAMQQGRQVDFEKLDWDGRCELLRSNPVTAARLFDHRVHEFITTVIKSDLQPIGCVTDFFYRVEYQQRGAPHIHALFWCKGAPTLDTDDDQTVIAYVDKYISCQLPDEKTDPDLHKMVEKVQTHRKNHTNSCKKGKKKCRFNFPKCIAKETFINKPHEQDTDQENSSDNTDSDISMNRAKECLKALAESLESKTLGNTSIEDLILQAGFADYDEFQRAMAKVATKTEIVMKREAKDVWINGYNPDLLRAWRANTDIQFILDPYSCVMYILSYISKSEHELGMIMKAAQEEIAAENVESDLRKKMKKLGSVYFENRELSIQEAVARTCSLKLKDSSRQVVFIPTDENARLSKPLSQLRKSAETDGDSEDVWMTSRNDRYKARPKEMETISQAEFASQYRVLPRKISQKQKQNPNVFALQNNLGYVQKRTRGKNAVIRFAKFSKTKDSEKFHESLLKLYLPHRHDAQLKPSRYASFEDFYENGSVKLTPRSRARKVKDIVDGNKELFNKSLGGLHEAWEQVQNAAPLEDAWAQISPESELERIEAMDEVDPDENSDALPPEEIPDLQDNSAKQPARSLISVELSGESVRPMLQTMNEKFYFVRDWCIRYAKGDQPEPFYLHVTGGAGTGKSHLIKCIYNEATKLLKNHDDPEQATVVLTAPTGTAAFNIGGFTIHSVFKIPKNAKAVYEPLSNDSVNTLQAQMSGLKILIIDEVSMVDRKILAYIHGRLKQVKCLRSSDREHLFGGVCVLAVGDFYQLPPVKAQPVCLPNIAYGSDMWNDHFQIASLDEIMRQKDDADFAELLNRLRTKSKLEHLSEQDNQALKERADRRDVPIDALHVFGKNKAVDAHNSDMLSKQCPQLQNIDAEDIITDVRKQTEYKRDKPKGGSSDNLPKKLEIGVGARVMLLRNIDVGDGLVNGAFGTVEDFGFSSNGITSIHVRFDSDKVGSQKKLENGCVAIERYEEKLTCVKNVTRRQFPLKLAWACTIHKVQGMTVKEIVFDMEGIFTYGQAYVALSRATSIRGLYLRNYNPKLIYRFNPVHEALKNMKQFQLGKNTETSDRAFHVIHHNIQGLYPKLKDMQCNTDMKGTAVLALTETWLSPQSKTVSLPGYRAFRCDRADGRGGGVCMYVSTDYETTLFDVQSDLECCCVTCFTQEYGKIMIATVYRAPRVNLGYFIPRLEDLLYSFQREKCDHVIVLGDFNEDQLKDGNHLISQTFANYGFKQTVTACTTVHRSLLDLVFLKSRTLKQTTSILPTYYSDHDAVKISLDYSQ